MELNLWLKSKQIFVVELVNITIENCEGKIKQIKFKLFSLKQIRMIKKNV